MENIQEDQDNLDFDLQMFKNDREASTSVPIRDKFYQALDDKIDPKTFVQNYTNGHAQWACFSYNIIDSHTRCRNDCIYCYMKPMNSRFKRGQDMEDLFVNDEKRIKKGWTKAVGDKSKTYMFPSSHDIFPEMVDSYIEVAIKMVKAGHRVLCVSKPRIECIEKISEKMEKYKNSFSFRFTISSDDDQILSIWEPNAPKFDERLMCLKLAFDKKYETSVSMEPFLSDPRSVIPKIMPYITGSIWIGIMTSRDYFYPLVDDTETERLDSIYNGQYLRDLIDELKNNLRIFWKNSVMKICLGYNVK